MKYTYTTYLHILFMLLLMIWDTAGEEHGFCLRCCGLLATVWLQSFSSYPPRSHWQITLSTPSLQPLLALLSLSGNLPVAGTSYKWNHTLFLFLCLPDVTKHTIFTRSFRVVAYCKVQFRFMTEWHSTMCIHQIVFIQSALDGLWKSFHLLAVVKNVTMTWVYRYPGIP